MRGTLAERAEPVEAYSGSVTICLLSSVTEGTYEFCLCCYATVKLVMGCWITCEVCKINIRDRARPNSCCLSRPVVGLLSLASVICWSAVSARLVVRPATRVRFLFSEVIETWSAGYWYSF